MASLREVEAATLTANSSVASLSDNKQATLSTLETEGGNSLESSVGFWGKMSGAESFIGIRDGQGVQDMCTAIDTYCTTVSSKLDNFAQTADPTGTFAGNYASAIQEFINSIKKSCLEEIDALTAFKKDLLNVEASMKAKDVNVADNITTEAGSLGGTTTESN